MYKFSSYNPTYMYKFSCDTVRYTNRGLPAEVILTTHSFFDVHRTSLFVGLWATRLAVLRSR